MIRTLRMLMGWVALSGLAWTAQTELAAELLEAQKLIREDQPREAIELLNQFLQSSPDEANAFFFRGTAHQLLGEHEKSAADFRRATELEPGHRSAHFNLGLIHLDQDQLDEAATQFIYVIALDDRDAAAFHYLAVIEDRRNQPGKALEFLEKALELEPDSTASQALLGALTDELGFFERSAESYAKAREASPNNPSLTFRWAQACRKWQRYTEAIDILTDLLDDPNLPEHYRPAIYLERGLCYMNSGDFKPARLELEKAREADPKNYEAALQLGITCLKLGDLPASVKALEYAIVYAIVGQHSSGEAHYQMCLAKQQLGKSEEAIQHCRRAIEERSYHAGAHYQLGRLLARSGNREKAQEVLLRFRELSKLEEEIEHYRHRLQVNPGDPGSFIALAKLYEKQGRTEDATEAYHSAVQFAPDEVSLHLVLTERLLEEGEPDEAIYYAETAVTLAPELSGAHYALASVFLAQERYEEAARELEKTLKLDPANLLAQCDRATLASRQGRYEEAREIFRKVLEADPELAQAHNGLGVAYLRLGEVEKAVESLKEAVRLDPDYASAHFNLAQAYRKLGKEEEARAEMALYQRLVQNRDGTDR